MPRQKPCQHPIKHGKSTRVPKGIVAVSVQLSKFIISQYDVAHCRVRWLCPRCHAFESKKMITYQSMECNEDESSSDDAINMEFNEFNEEENQNPLMDSGIIAESDDNDDELPRMDDEKADPESMDEEVDDVSYELEHMKDKAIEEPSTIFELIKYNLD